MSLSASKKHFSRNGVGDSSRWARNSRSEMRPLLSRSMPRKRRWTRSMCESDSLSSAWKETSALKWVSLTLYFAAESPPFFDAQGPIVANANRG